MNIPDDVILPRRLWSELVHWRAGYACEDCRRGRQELAKDGYSGRHLHAHHLDHDDTNNRLSNGKCLCPPCHGKHHRSQYEILPCEPGCTCGKHKESWNKIKPGQKCKNGHDDWVVWGGQAACRTCRNEYGRRYYRENKEYARLQGERANERKRRLRGESD